MRILMLALAGAFVSGAAGGRQAAAPVLKPDAFEVVRLADGVHAVLRQDPPDDAANANVLVIVNEQDVVVVDANLTPGSSEATIAAIRRLTPNPVRYVINTHWHDDHVIGNSAYADAFPGVEFIGHASTRARMLDTVAPSLVSNRTAYADALRDLDARLVKGEGANGKPMTGAQRAAESRLADLYRGFLAEMPRMRVVAPDVIVNESLVIRRGAREIRVLYLGRGNTAGDLVVHLPNEGIVATGDLLVHPIPFAFESYPGAWADTLGRLADLGAGVMMPGHGPLLRDATHLASVRGALAAIGAHMRDAVARGLTLEQARKTLDVSAHQARLTSANPALAGAFTGMFITPATERAFLEAKGEIR